MGRCYDHPTPLSFQHRLKLNIMGKETTVLSSSTNTTESEPTPAITEGLQAVSGSSECTVSFEDSCLTSHVFTPEISATDSELDGSTEDEFDLTFPEEEALDHFLGYVVYKFQSIHI
ncbi:hypothetical protein Pcinc_011266 [Petrolisthes cinctipes]|uniref:Uncharacterized protein n=1 Tax=Petrolisthes cinctipes TaxID=88211 RepID=A0AAE1G187_PETCI|nr:hypothetical protein Pcinc_011266 [Petrolisthes cinctipes]